MFVSKCLRLCNHLIHYNNIKVCIAQVLYALHLFLVITTVVRQNVNIGTVKVQLTFRRQTSLCTFIIVMRDRWHMCKMSINVKYNNLVDPYLTSVFMLPAYPLPVVLHSTIGWFNICRADERRRAEDLQNIQVVRRLQRWGRSLSSLWEDR